MWTAAVRILMAVGTAIGIFSAGATVERWISPGQPGQPVNQQPSGQSSNNLIGFNFGSISLVSLLIAAGIMYVVYKIVGKKFPG
jgi:hypothetical protein